MLYGGVASYCIRGETTDPARFTVCDSLAGKLLDHDISVLGPRTAIRIGEKIGWDPARLQSHRDQSAVEYALAFDVETTGNVFTCENLAKGISWWRNSLSKGDRAVMRERFAKSGKTMTDFIDEFRKTSPSLFK